MKRAPRGIPIAIAAVFLTLCGCGSLFFGLTMYRMATLAPNWASLSASDRESTLYFLLSGPVEQGVGEILLAFLAWRYFGRGGPVPWTFLGIAGILYGLTGFVRTAPHVMEWSGAWKGEIVAMSTVQFAFYALAGALCLLQTLLQFRK